MTLYILLLFLSFQKLIFYTVLPPFPSRYDVPLAGDHIYFQVVGVERGRASDAKVGDKREGGELIDDRPHFSALECHAF